MRTANSNLIFSYKKRQSIIYRWKDFSIDMATLRNKKKLAASIKENSEEHLRSNMAQNSNVPESQEDSITHVSEEIEGRVTKRLNQEFSRTGNRILGALARLDDFVTNRLIQGCSGGVPECIKYKPKNEREQLLEWSSSWGRHLRQPDEAKLWPRRWPRHSDRSSRGSHLMLL